MQIATLTSFPSLPSSTGGSFYGEYVSDSGIVVGTLGNSDRVALWQNGSLTDLGFSGDPMAINASGEVAGFNWGNSSVLEQAFIWKDGAETILTGFSGSISDWANGLNDLGVVVGQSSNPLGNDQAVMWQNGQLTALGFLPGGTSSSATAINDKGQIIGYSNAADGQGHRVIWQNGTITDLGILKSGDYIYASALNNDGVVVGYEQPNTYLPADSVAWTWRDGVIAALPGLENYAWSYAEAVNDSGIVAGKVAKPNPDYSSSSFYVYHAVIWQDGQIIDLNSLLPIGSKWVLEDARSINDQGEIVGSATYDGTATSFMLTLGDGATPQAQTDAATALSVTLTVPTAILDKTANILANLDGLEGLAVAGTLAGITLTDGGVPNLAVSQTQFLSDRVALAYISDAHSVTVQMGESTGQFNVATSSLFAGATALQFSDQTLIVAQAPSATAVTTGNLTELYAAVFAREPDVGGLAYYQSYLKANPGTPLLQFAEWFLASPEYSAAHGYPQTSAGDQQFIVDSYRNLLNRTPSADEIAYYQTHVMTAGGQTHAQMLVYFSASPEFLADVQITASQKADASHWLVLT